MHSSIFTDLSLDWRDDIFRRISLNEKFYILIRISLKFVPQGRIDYKSA